MKEVHLISVAERDAIGRTYSLENTEDRIMRVRWETMNENSSWKVGNIIEQIKKKKNHAG